MTPGYVVVSSGVSAQFTAGTSVNANQKFWIQLPTTASIVNNTAPGGPYTLTVRDFLVSANVAAACVKYALTPPGPAEKPSCPTVKAGTNLTFQVGATVDINANQAAGTYAGTFAVTVHNL